MENICFRWETSRTKEDKFDDIMDVSYVLPGFQEYSYGNLTDTAHVHKNMVNP